VTGWRQRVRRMSAVAQAAPAMNAIKSVMDDWSLNRPAF
jgi:hypothetical protein